MIAGPPAKRMPTEPLTREDVERRILDKHGPGKIALVSYAGRAGSTASEFRCLANESHGTWTTSANGVINSGTGCSSCSGRKHLTSEDVERRIVERHGPGKVALVSYGGNNKKPSMFRCLVDPAHDDWKTNTGSVLNAGTVCPSCSRTQRSTREDVERRIVDRLGPNRIEISSYAGSASGRSKFRCLVNPRHKTWTTTASRVISAGTGCPSCSGKKRLSVSEIKRRIVKTHGRGRIALISYAGSGNDTSSEFRCLVDESHGNWTTSTGHVTHAGSGCPRCASERAKSGRS